MSHNKNAAEACRRDLEANSVYSIDEVREVVK